MKTPWKKYLDEKENGHAADFVAFEKWLTGGDEDDVLGDLEYMARTFLYIKFCEVLHNAEKELKRACRIMADLVTVFLLPLEDSTYDPYEDTLSAFEFLREYGFADKTERGTYKIHWKKLEEKP